MVNAEFLGHMSREEWKRYLASNAGLFKRQSRAPKEVVGPTLDDQGKVIGDMLSMETACFMGHPDISDDQKHFYAELLDHDHTAAVEYLLTVLGAIDVWKNDIHWLEVAVQFLEKEEEMLSMTEELVLQQKRLSSKFRLPDALKNHFPHLFVHLHIVEEDEDKSLSDIKLLVEKIHEEREHIIDYLKKKRKELPFLFE